MSETEKAAEDLGAIAAEEKSSELSILKESLDDSRRKADDYYDQLLRLKAEFENYRRRVEKEKTESRRWGKEEVLIRFLSLFDVMDQAEAAAEAGADMKSVTAGLRMLYGEFKRMLRDEGLEEVPAEGKKFDHALHEAVETVAGPGEEGRVLSVLQKGYTFHGAVLRPARVKVSKRAEPKEE